MTGRTGDSGTATARLAVDGGAGVATLVLDRPEKRNALSAEMVEELLRLLAAVEADERARVVAIRGAGPDFCAGADLAEVRATQRAGVEAGVRDARRLADLFVAIRRLRQPVVAVVAGRALGGGCGLVAACDAALAREDAVLGYPEVRLGFVPALVAAPLKRKVGATAAFELLTRGDRLDGTEAAALGLVTRALPAESFEDRAGEYLADLARMPPNAVQWTKRLFHGLDGLRLEEAFDRAAEVNAIVRATDECKAGVRDFLERRRARGARPE